MIEQATMPKSAPAPKVGKRRLRLGAFRQLVLLPVIVAALVIGSQINGSFLSSTNIFENILGASVPLALVTVAESMLIIAGRFDLSLQSTVGLAPMLAAGLVVSKADYGFGTELSPVLGVLALFAVGAGVGILNGFMVAKLRLNAFVVTLAMLILLQGLTVGASRGQTITSLPDSFTYLASASWIGIPVQVWLAVVVFVAAGLFMRYHPVGREIYAIGGNEEAARAAGVKVERIVFGLFVVGSLLAALAGLVISAQIASTTASQGQDLIFTVFAAAVIGGVDLQGGRGTMAGAATGVLLLGVIQNLLVVAEVPSFWVSAIYGGLILLSLMLGAAAGSSQIDRVFKGVRSLRSAKEPAGEQLRKDA